MVDSHGRVVVTVHSKLTAVSSKPVGPGKTHPLTVLDHAMGLHTLHIIFYYKNNPFGSFDLDPLRTSLSELLSLYPPVTGRLAREDAGNWEVKCNDAGVRVLKAKVGVTMDEWLRSVGDGYEEKDLTTWENMPEDSNMWSPFRVQINEFEGGGVAIGLSCTHMQADPTCATLLFKSWTEVHRQEAIQHPPVFRPSALLHRQVANSQVQSTSYYATKASAEVPSVRMATATFKFSNSMIKQSLSEIHDKCPDATPFDLLAALFWTRITRLKSPSPDNNYSLSICLDFRKVLQPSLPLGYFGNALHFSQLSLNAEEMDWSGLGNVAELVHRHAAKIQEEEVWSIIDWLESHKREGGKNLPPFRMYGPELTCVSMEHMIIEQQPLMYAAMFEEGVGPVHVTYQVGNVEGEGLIMVMPSAQSGFARTVMVTLPEEEINTLCEDQAILCLEPTMLHRSRPK